MPLEPFEKTLETVVFLHHFGGSGRSWGEVIARLPDFQCFAPDLRGFGEAEDTPDTWSVDASADSIAARIEAQKIKRYTLVGHSMGGKIALALAARRPTGLKRLILLAPSPPTPEPLKNEDRERLLEGFGSRAEAEETLRKVTAKRLPPALHALALADILRSGGGAWRAWLQSGSRENIAARMNRIHVPTLVVAGECDAVMTPDLLRREVVERLADARMETIADAAHLLPLENPEAIVASIRRATLNEHPESAP